MSQTSMNTVLRLLVLNAAFERQFSPALTSIYGVSLSEFLLLLHLARAPLGRMRRVDLGSVMNLAQSSVTRLIVPLEEEGLVDREADTRDARVVYAVITEKGRERVLSATKTLDEMSAGIFDDRWSDDEISSLFTLLGRVGRSLPTALG